MRKALSTLPWVATDTIKPDTSKQTVRFGFKNAKDWNFIEVKKTIEDKTNFEVGDVLEGP